MHNAKESLTVTDEESGAYYKKKESVSKTNQLMCLN